jgi:hypothetical protein
LNFRKTLLVFIVAVLALSGCKKYPDGPWISLLTKKYRLAEDWKKTKIYKNGSDITTQYLSHIQHESFNLDKSGNFNYSITTDASSLSYGGNWTFNSDKTVLFFSYFLGQQSITDTYLILRLKEHDMWLQQTTQSGDTMEYHYSPN